MKFSNTEINFDIQNLNFCNIEINIDIHFNFGSQPWYNMISRRPIPVTNQEISVLTQKFFIEICNTSYRRTMHICIALHTLLETIQTQNLVIFCTFLVSTNNN